MRIAAAQLCSIAGDVEANLVKHLAMVDEAAASGAALIFFPELSLTGYEPRLASSLAMSADDARLDVFQQRSDRHGLIIGVGLPLRVEATLRARIGVQIALVFYRPALEPAVYAKRILHEDEVPFFVPGQDPLVLELASEAGDRRLVPAICYESLQPEHAEQAAELGADVYLASVAKPNRGLEKARLYFPAMAKRHGLAVVMANCIGPSDNFVGAGGSAAWDRSGERLAQLSDDEEAWFAVDL